MNRAECGIVAYFAIFVNVIIASIHAPRLPSPAAQGKLATRDGDLAFLEAKLVTARFYAEVVLPPAAPCSR